MNSSWLLAGVTAGALLLVAGCGSDGTAITGTSVGLANPASQYCVSQGGEVVMVTAASGAQQGICRLSDGTEVDEWEYFRASQTPDSDGNAAGPASTAPPASPVITNAEAQATAFDVYLQAADVGPGCDRVVAVRRSATVKGPEADALAQLLAGPTAAEEAQGLRSWFSPATAGMLRSVAIDGRVARVDFDPGLAVTIPSASASCGSSLLLAQLDGTIGQFDTADRVVYSLGGDVDAFYAWLQRPSPEH